MTLNCIWWCGYSSWTLGCVKSHFQCHYFQVHSYSGLICLSRHIGWGCRICCLHLCRGIRHPLTNEYLEYDTKPSDGQAPILELSGIIIFSSLSFLSGPTLTRSGNNFSGFIWLSVFYLGFFFLLLLLYRAIGSMCRVFVNGPGDWSSIPGRVIIKILKMVLDAALLNAQHYKVMIKGKMEQPREWSSALSYTLV